MRRRAATLRPVSRPARATRALTTAAAALLLAGCGAGFDAQTGLVQGGIGAQAEVGQVNVLNVLLVAPAEEGGESNEGQTAAALVAGVVNEAEEADRLVAVSLPEADGEVPSTLPPGGVELPTDRLVSFNSESGQPLTILGPSDLLRLGTTVQVRMSFERAGDVTVPAVVYAAEGDYAEVSPQPPATEPASPGASPAATPTG